MIRNAIAAGEIPGPRLKACGPEITVTGGLGDERSAHMYRESFAVIADGPAEIVKWARLCCREGADSIKLNVSGDNLYRAAQAEMTVMSEAEIRVTLSVGWRATSIARSTVIAGRRNPSSARCAVAST